MPELIRGRIIAFDAPSHTLTAQIAGSLATAVDGVPVSRSIGEVDLVVGRRVAIAQFDTASHRDAMVVGCTEDRSQLSERSFYRCPICILTLPIA